MLEIYDQIKLMVVGFYLCFGDRFNESVLLKDFGVFCIFLCEVFNWLVVEGFIDVCFGEGFFCCKFNVEYVYNFYDLCEVIEVVIVVWICECVSDDVLKMFFDWLVVEGLDVVGLSVVEVCVRDEVFYIKIVDLLGNLLLVV